VAGDGVQLFQKRIKVDARRFEVVMKAGNEKN